MKQLIFMFSLISLAACNRDHSAKPARSATPPDGRSKFVGTYDVYDTMSNWLYEMELTLIEGTPIDSVRLSGWGGAFNLYAQHHSNDQSSYLNLVGGFGVHDYEGHRWALYTEYDSAFMSNRLVNDTFRIAYFKDNIAFYVADGVPYFRHSYREYAVKRDWE